MPLCVLLGGSVGPVKAYNSNGLWLQPPEVLAADAIALRDEGGFTGLKLRLGRDRARDDLAAIDAIRTAVGEDMELMADFNQGLNFADALQRCHMIDDAGLDLDRGADRLRQFRRLCAACGGDQNADPDRREFLWPARSPHGAADARRATL